MRSMVNSFSKKQKNVNDTVRIETIKDFTKKQKKKELVTNARA